MKRKFKDHADYKAQRDALIDEAEKLLNEGKMEDYKAKVEEVKELDADFETWAEAQANIAAMKGAVKPPFSVGARDAVIDAVNLGGQAETDGELEYRKQFMNFVMNKTPVSMKNAGETTTAGDVGTVIPTTIVNRIVQRMEQSGNILNKITKTYYRGGVSIPTSDAKPEAQWVAETGDVDRQKKTTGSVIFAYYKLKVKVSVSIITKNVTLDIFEKQIAADIADAVTKALEKAIINGTGTGQPKGILNETVPEGQDVEIDKAFTYADICKIEGTLPSAYDAAVWCMNKKTYMSQIAAMVDTNGQPIGRIDHGIDGKPTYTILGRHVEFTEHMAAMNASTAAGTAVAFLFRFEDYMLNTNMNITVSKYTDNDTDEEITKAIMLADGKVFDNNSLVMVKTKNA